LNISRKHYLQKMTANQMQCCVCLLLLAWCHLSALLL